MTVSITRNGLTVTAETQKELFEELAKHQEVFGILECGKCQETELKYVVRKVEDNDFYELRCQNSKCRAKLSFGVHKGKDGTLFPHRKDANGAYLTDNGWRRWNPETKQEE